MRRSLNDIASMVRNYEYSNSLPDELKEFHAYIIDSGHCLCAVSKKHFEEWLNAETSEDSLDMYSCFLRRSKRERD